LLKISWLDVFICSSNLIASGTELTFTGTARVADDVAGTAEAA
jgi:hypothetical protein